jgi:hypothetical protein
MAAATAATSLASTGEVRPVPKGRRIVPSLVIDSAGQFRVRKIYCEREKRAIVQKSSDKREIGAACERGGGV